MRGMTSSSGWRVVHDSFLIRNAIYFMLVCAKDVLFAAREVGMNLAR